MHINVKIIDMQSNIKKLITTLKRNTLNSLSNYSLTMFNRFSGQIITIRDEYYAVVESRPKMATKISYVRDEQRSFPYVETNTQFYL